MTRRPAFRILALSIAMWFAVCAIRPAFVTPCAHHDPALAELAMMMGDHAAMTSHAHHGTQDSHHSHGSNCCDCLGACCGVAAPSVAPAALTFAPEAVIRRPAYDVPVLLFATRPLPAHTLPFSIAPPSTLSIA